MNDSPYLIVDGNYLSHFVFYGMGGLHNIEGEPTGVIYGMLVQVKNLMIHFRTKRLIFCWDSVSSVRKKIFPKYKASRKKTTLEEKQLFGILYQQIRKLQNEYLPRIGFPCYMEEGFESDDCMAWFAKQLGEKNSVWLITADADLYQCLSPNVSLYSPASKKIMNVEMFREKYKIDPEDWAYVKAIAGCSTDGVPGVKGVGEMTAAKILNGEMTKGKKYDAVFQQNDQFYRNWDLVHLPHEDFPPQYAEWPRWNIKAKEVSKIGKEIGSANIADSDNVFEWHNINKRF